MMKKELCSIAIVAMIAGCGVDAYVEAGDPSPVEVGVALPPPRYEVAGNCVGNTTWISGRWNYRGGRDPYVWQRGYCDVIPAGRVYIAPRYVNGMYYRAHYGLPSASTAVEVRPAPAYVPPPVEVRPAPAYVPPPVEVRPAPAVEVRRAPVYVPPRQTPVEVRPAPEVRPGSVYVPPPGR